MKAIFQPIKMAGRVGYVIAAWVLVAMVFVQVFHAGSAVLVNPGNWGAHVGFGHMIGLPIMLLALLSLIGWMPVRFFLLSLGLWALYAMQYVFLHVPKQVGLPALTALHPVNALVIFAVAAYSGRRAYQFVTEGWQRDGSARRAALVGVVAVCALGVAAAGLRSGGWAGEGAGGGRIPSLAGATEADLPERYRGVQVSAFPADGAVAAGRQIAEQRCIACHAADFKGKELGGVRSADLTQSAASRSERFLMWAISEGSQRGMPSFRSELSEVQRWQLVAFIKGLKR